MASAPSSSGPVEAPVKTLTWNFWPRKLASAMWRASSMGTALGYPDPVNPLMPTWSPEWMRAAASSALMIFCASWEFKTLAVVETVVAMYDALQQKGMMIHCNGREFGRL